MAVASKKKLAYQPFHDKLEGIQTMFKAKRIGDPLTAQGYEDVVSTESFADLYVREMEGIISNEGDREVFKHLVAQNIKEERNPFSAFSQEGFELAPNTNYNQFSNLNSWTILGYIARSKCLELFFQITNDKPTITYEYNLSYVRTADDREFPLPFAVRDGSIGNALDLPEALPLVSVDNPHIEELTVDTVTSNWIMIGSRGNLLSEAGFAPAKYALERNIEIGKIRYDFLKLDGTTHVTGTMDIHLGRAFVAGDQANRSFYETYTVAYTDSGAKTKTFSILGSINLDTSEYMVGQAGDAIVTHFQFGEARVTNLANELGTLRAGNKKIIQTFDVNNRIYGTVPIGPELTDDFNAGGDGVSYTAYMVDKITEAYSGIRDLDMESVLDKAYLKTVTQFPLAPKLGGYKKDVTFPLTARGAGGGDPFSWVRDGLRDTIRHTFVDAETETYFETGTPRQWIILGHETDTQRIPDITYANYSGDGGAENTGGVFKYGFAVDVGAGFSDSFGRRVKVIGSHYKRHSGKAMRAVQKSMTIEQPTTVYFPYSFRVFAGISPEYRNRPALCVATRDYIGVLASVQARIDLVGNDADLYEKLSKNSAGITP